MKLTTKLLSIMVLILLASPVILLKGCGKAINGGQCGGCPDSTAPQGATVTNTIGMTAGTISSSGSACYESVSFLFKGSDGVPLNDICVELTAVQGVMALRKPSSAQMCGDVITDPKTYIRTRTDGTGTVAVDFVVACSTSYAASGATSISAAVQAVSCNTSAKSTVAITVSSPGCP